MLYLLMIRPVLAYASPVWGYAAPSLIGKLQILQNKDQLIAGMPRYVLLSLLHKELGVPPIREFIRDIAVRLYCKAQDSESGLIRGLGKYHPTQPLSRHKRPHSLLDKVYLQVTYPPS
jgi:hypothetical protein